MFQKHSKLIQKNQHTSWIDTIGHLIFILLSHVLIISPYIKSLHNWNKCNNKKTKPSSPPHLEIFLAKMASWAELKRAGADGFAIVEEYIVRPATRRRPVSQQVHSHGCLYQHHPNHSVEHHLKPAYAADYEVVQFRDAAPVLDYSKRKSRAVGY